MLRAFLDLFQQGLFDAMLENLWLTLAMLAVGVLLLVKGGGFTGTVQAFVPFDILESFREGMDAVLVDGACHVLSIRPEGGVEVQ